MPRELDLFWNPPAWLVFNKAPHIKPTLGRIKLRGRAGLIWEYWDPSFQEAAGPSSKTGKGLIYCPVSQVSRKDNADRFEVFLEHPTTGRLAFYGNSLKTNAFNVGWMWFDFVIYFYKLTLYHTLTVAEGLGIYINIYVILKCKMLSKWNFFVGRSFSVRKKNRVWRKNSSRP